MAEKNDLTGKIITTTEVVPNENADAVSSEPNPVGIDPSLEARLYLSKKDVYELFKVTIYALGDNFLFNDSASNNLFLRV